MQLANILLDEHKVPKLCDTGLARILEASAISSGKPHILPASWYPLRLAALILAHGV